MCSQGSYHCARSDVKELTATTRVGAVQQEMTARLSHTLTYYSSAPGSEATARLLLNACIVDIVCE